MSLREFSKFLDNFPDENHSKTLPKNNGSLSDKIHNPIAPKGVMPNNWLFEEDVKEAVKELKERMKNKVVQEIIDEVFGEKLI